MNWLPLHLVRYYVEVNPTNGWIDPVERWFNLDRVDTLREHTLWHPSDDPCRTELVLSGETYYVAEPIEEIFAALGTAPQISLAARDLRAVK